MQQCIKFILFRNDTLHVSDGLFVHHQEFKTVHRATGICQTDAVLCLLASRQQRKDRPKHVECHYKIKYIWYNGAFSWFYYRKNSWTQVWKLICEPNSEFFSLNCIVRTAFNYFNYINKGCHVTAVDIGLHKNSYRVKLLNLFSKLITCRILDHTHTHIHTQSTCEFIQETLLEITTSSCDVKRTKPAHQWSLDFPVLQYNLEIKKKTSRIPTSWNVAYCI